MIICICNEVTDRKIKKITIKNREISTVEDLQKHIEICDRCRACRPYIQTIINQISSNRDT